MSTSVVYLFFAVLLWASAADDIPTSSPSPTSSLCFAWVDRCTGQHHCTHDNNSTTINNSSCFPLIPTGLTPAPGVCMFVNGSCQFVDPCVAWNKACYGAEYNCTTKAQVHNNSCGHYRPSPPPPKEECLPINGSCQWYNPCRKWPGFCGGPYQCITKVQYYRYTHGPQPSCPVPQQPQSRPPGECIYLQGQCVWSSEFLLLLNPPLFSLHHQHTHHHYNQHTFSAIIHPPLNFCRLYVMAGHLSPKLELCHIL